MARHLCVPPLPYYLRLRASQNSIRHSARLRVQYRFRHVLREGVDERFRRPIILKPRPNLRNELTFPLKISRRRRFRFYKEIPEGLVKIQSHPRRQQYHLQLSEFRFRRSLPQYSPPYRAPAMAKAKNPM